MTGVVRLRFLQVACNYCTSPRQPISTHPNNRLLDGSVFLNSQKYLTDFEQFRNLTVTCKIDLLSRNIALRSPQGENLSFDHLLENIPIDTLSHANYSKTQEQWDKKGPVGLPLEGKFHPDQTLISQHLPEILTVPTAVTFVGSWNGHKTFLFLKILAATGIERQKNLVLSATCLDTNLKATRTARIVGLVLGLDPTRFLTYQGNAIEQLPPRLKGAETSPTALHCQ